MDQPQASRTHPGVRLSLAVGAAAIWMAWWLMPDAAIADAGHILESVARLRASVRLSAVLQLAGSALLVVGLTDETARRPRGWRVGAWLLSMGAVGMGADAVYHQVAYEMTAEGVDRLAVTPVMIGMQTRELHTLAPLLLAFLLGAPVLGFGWIADGRSRTAGWLLASPLFTIPAGIVASRATGLPRRFVALVVLGEICAGLATAAVWREGSGRAAT
jgi:hypothetical protein